MFFSNLSYGGHFVQLSRTIWAIVVDSLMRSIIILNFGQQFRCCLKIFLFSSMVAILFGGAEPFGQFW